MDTTSRRTPPAAAAPRPVPVPDDAGTAPAPAVGSKAFRYVAAALRIATGSGVAVLVMMWSAALPPENNPVVDDHLIYALMLVALLLCGSGRTLGLGQWWARLPLVSRHAALQ
jgi:hypothetical protein